MGRSWLHWLKILRGDLNAVSAFMGGKIKA